MKTSIADARVEQRVAEIDQQVDDDIDRRENEDQTLHDRIVAAQDGIGGQAAEAGDVEDRFRDHHAAEQRGDADADDGDDRHRGILQRMANDDAPRRDALGGGSADVILGQHFEQARPGDAGEQRGIEHRQRQARKDEAVKAGQEARRKRHVALRRKPSQPQREDIDQQEGDDEDRRREAEHRESHDGPVEAAARLHRRDRPQRQGDEQRHDDRDQRKHRRRLDAKADQMRHRHVREHGAAEIAARDLACPVEHLLEKRPVQPELFADHRDLVSRGLVASDQHRGVAGRQAEEKEDEQRNEAEHRHSRGDAAQQIDHADAPTSARRNLRKATTSSSHALL